MALLLDLVNFNPDGITAMIVNLVRLKPRADTLIVTSLPIDESKVKVPVKLSPAPMRIAALAICVMQQILEIRNI